MSEQGSQEKKEGREMGSLHHTTRPRLVSIDQKTNCNKLVSGGLSMEILIQVTNPMVYTGSSVESVG